MSYRNIFVRNLCCYVGTEGEIGRNYFNILGEVNHIVSYTLVMFSSLLQINK